MKLNVEGKQELRTFVEGKLASVPEGQKIKFSKEKLEFLLFDEIQDKKSNTKEKELVWIGESLKKFDLSEIIEQEIKAFRNKIKLDLELDLIRNPYRNRIKIDKELLEKLLFDEYIFKSNRRLRIPVWSGDFLSRIDLSEVSFEDVGWSVACDASLVDIVPDFCEFEDEYGDYSIFDSRDDRVCYKNTNAFIDLEKSYEYKIGGKIDIYCCDFSGTSLAHVDSKQIISIDHCNLSNTGIVFKNLDEDIIIDKSDFSGCNMKDAKIAFHNCDILSNNFKNTGVQLEINFSDESSTYDLENLKKEFKRAMENDYLTGCYVNGIKILSSEEKIALAQKKKKEYEQFKEDVLKSYIQDIETQMVKGKN